MDVSPGPMTPSKLKNLLSRPALPAYGYHSDRKIGIKKEGRKDAGNVSDPIIGSPGKNGRRDAGPSLPKGQPIVAIKTGRFGQDSKISQTSSRKFSPEL